jgi:hypothetical protein
MRNANNISRNGKPCIRIDNIKTDIMEIWSGYAGWIQMALD